MRIQLNRIIGHRNWKGVLLIALLFCSQACSNQSEIESASGESSIIFQNVTVIDALNQVRSNQSVVITGNKITAVGPAEGLAVPEESIVVDGAGKYLIPGLWDAHVHLTFIEALEPVMFPLFIANGVTSIRDTGGQLHKVNPWKEQAERNPGSSPRVFIAGPLLDGLPNVYDGSPNRPEISVGLGSLEAVTKKVDTLVSAGVDLLKAYEMLTPEQFRAVIEEGKKHGLPVTGHVPLSMLATEASSAGLRSMEHLRNLEMACSADADSLLAERRQMLSDGAGQPGGALRSAIHRAQRLHAINTYDEARAGEVMQVLADNGTWQIPTLALLTGRLKRIFADESWKKTFAYLPEPNRSEWNARAGKSAQATPDSTSLALGRWGLEMTGRLHDAGVGFMAGTDTPIGFLTPGFSLHRELEMLVAGGLTPLEAIEAATLRPAQYFGLEDTLGTIEAGKLADLVLLDANPLADIRNTTRINAVVKDGQLFDRTILNNMLEQLAE